MEIKRPQNLRKLFYKKRRGHIFIHSNIYRMTVTLETMERLIKIKLAVFPRRGTWMKVSGENVMSLLIVNNVKWNRSGKTQGGGGVGGRAELKGIKLTSEAILHV